MQQLHKSKKMTHLRIDLFCFLRLLFPTLSRRCVDVTSRYRAPSINLLWRGQKLEKRGVSEESLPQGQQVGSQELCQGLIAAVGRLQVWPPSAPGWSLIQCMFGSGARGGGDYFLHALAIRLSIVTTRPREGRVLVAGRTHVSRALRSQNDISEHESSRGWRIVPPGAADRPWPTAPCFSAYKRCLNFFSLSCSRPQPPPRQATFCSRTLSLPPSSRKSRDSKAFLSQPPTLPSWPTNRSFGSLYKRHSWTTRMNAVFASFSAREAIALFYVPEWFCTFLQINVPCSSLKLELCSSIYLPV